VVAAELQGLALLSGATRPQLDALAALLGRAEYAAGEVLFAEGDTGQTFVILVDGTVAVSRATRSGSGSLGVGAKGAIFGELSTITGEPRRATVTATSDVVAVTGGVDAFDALIAIPGVMDRLVDLATQRLAEIARPVRAQLPDGTDVWIRPLVARDREEFAAALARQPDEWRHRRFFSAVRPSPALIDYLVHLDYVGHFAWSVGRPPPVGGIGTARFIRSRDELTRAEVAFEVEDSWHGRGVATLLLGALGAAASRVGITTFRAEVLYENRAMRAVLNKAGAHWEHAETGVMETDVAVDGTRPLIPAEWWSALGAVTDEIVEVAGLALWRAAAGDATPTPTSGEPSDGRR
jgi:CRP-like cAMP-binding protein